MRVSRFLVVFLLLAGTGLSQSIVGTIDGYYGYNFNKPGGKKNLYRNFDFNHNQFSLNYAEIAVEQKPGSNPLGFRADVGFGDAATWVHASEPAGANIYQHLQQAYVSYGHKKAQFDFGKFVTPLGAEVIETKDNWNYSRSLLFSWAIPYYHFGLRTTVAINDKVSLAGYVVNGWNNVQDNNEGKTVGISVTAKGSKLTWAGNYIAGKEQDTDDIRQVFDTTLTLDANSKVSLMANYDYGHDRLAGAYAKWQGLALYGRFSPTSRIRISPRWEWFDDPQGFATGTDISGFRTPQTLHEGTLTLDVVANDGMFVRGEYRYDSSDERIFQRRSTELRSHQSTLTVGVVFTYTKTR